MKTNDNFKKRLVMLGRPVKVKPTLMPTSKAMEIIKLKSGLYAGENLVRRVEHEYFKAYERRLRIDRDCCLEELTSDILSTVVSFALGVESCFYLLILEVETPDKAIEEKSLVLFCSDRNSEVEVTLTGITGIEVDKYIVKLVNTLLTLVTISTSLTYYSLRTETLEDDKLDRCFMYALYKICMLLSTTDYADKLEIMTVRDRHNLVRQLQEDAEKSYEELMRIYSM